MGIELGWEFMFFFVRFSCFFRSVCGRVGLGFVLVRFVFVVVFWRRVDFIVGVYSRCI